MNDPDYEMCPDCDTFDLLIQWRGLTLCYDCIEKRRNQMKKDEPKPVPLP